MHTPNALATLIAEAITAHTTAPAPHPQYAPLDPIGALVLPLLDTDPPAPTNGGGLLYLFDTGSAVEVRVRTAAGVVTVGP